MSSGHWSHQVFDDIRDVSPGTTTEYDLFLDIRHQGQQEFYKSLSMYSNTLLLDIVFAQMSA